MSRILVIEDERSVRENIIELLTLEGYDPIPAENGQKGYFLATTENFDLVICDILMPLMDGFEVVQRIRKHPHGQTLPVIFLTAKTQRESMREGMELGADDYISKPFTRKELLNSIQARLTKQQANQAAAQRRINHFESNLSLFLPLEIMNPLADIRDSSEMLCDPRKNINKIEPEKIGKHINLTVLDLIDVLTKYVFLYDLETVQKKQKTRKMTSKIRNAGHFIRSILVEKNHQIKIFPYKEFSLFISEDELSKLTEMVAQVVISATKPESSVQLSMKIDSTGEWASLLFQFQRRIQNLTPRFEANGSEPMIGLDRDLVILTRIVGLLGGQLLAATHPANEISIEIRLPAEQTE
jgi:two-component system, sensor histidine kinase and response regulator